MLLKIHLIEVFKKASSENNILLKENIVLKWVHRFGIDSLDDLLIHSPVQREYKIEEENQEQPALMNKEEEEENQEQPALMNKEEEEENQEQPALMNKEEGEENQVLPALMNKEEEEENQELPALMNKEEEEENQEQITLELTKTFENIEETKWESNRLDTSSSNGIISKDQNSNKINQFTDSQKLPLPNIKNLRKWINKDKKAS